jgi:hypothetical protein
LPLSPGETGTYPYSFDFPASAAAKRVEARLLFRVAPPYFLRALAKDQPPTEIPKLDTFVSALEVTEMAKIVIDL